MAYNKSDWIDITNELKELQKETNDLSKKRSDIYTRAWKTVKTRVKEEKLLGNIWWDLETVGSSYRLVADRNDNGIAIILAMLDVLESNISYHFSLDLADSDGTLRFNDNEVSIDFDNVDKLIKVSKEYGIKFGLYNIDKEIKYNATELYNLLKIKHTLKDFIK